MYNQQLIKLLQYGAIAVVVILLLSLGFGAGSIYEKTQAKKATPKVQKVTPSSSSVEEEGVVLTEKEVKEFLLTYYTKIDLGEKRNRYKPLMTNGLYEATIKEEDSAVYQAYKGYLVDQVFEAATIYIDKENKAAIAQVSYTSTLLSEKENRNGLSTNQTTAVSIRLDYVLENGKFLVNRLTPIAITDSMDKTNTRFQPMLPRSSSSSDTTSSDEKTQEETETETSQDDQQD